MYRNNRPVTPQYKPDYKVKERARKSDKIAKQKHAKKVEKTVKQVNPTDVSTDKLSNVFFVILLVIIGALVIGGALLFVKQYNSAPTKYYRWLEVKKDASSSQIRDAYDELTVKYNPQTHPDCKNCEKKLKQIKEAYEGLKKM